MIPSGAWAAYCGGMEICALALISVRSSKRGASALVRITAPGKLLWRRYRVALPMTADGVQAMARAAARHLAPHGGRVRLSFQLPLLGIRAVEKEKEGQ